MTEVEKIKKECLERIRDMCTEEAIKFIDRWIFELDMIDRWDDNTRIRYTVLCDILRELQKGIKR